MPIVNGIELSNAIKKKDNDQIIVVFSSSEDVHFFMELIDIGVDGFIPKPFDNYTVFKKLIKALETISYRKLIDDLKRDQIIQEFIKDNSELKESLEKIKTRKKDSIYREYSTIASLKLSEDINVENIIENEQEKAITKPEEVISAKDLFKYFEYQKIDKKLLKNKINTIVINIQEVEDLISELIFFAKNIELQLGYCKGEDVITEIARKMSIIYYALDEFDILSGIADGFFEMHTFFSGFKVLDNLTPQEIEGFISVEFVLADIKRFVQTVFIDKTASDIFIYDSLFKANLEQLETNIKHPNTDFDDDSKDDLEFF